jgi:hypothetical protein
MMTLASSLLLRHTSSELKKQYFIRSGIYESNFRVKLSNKATRYLSLFDGDYTLSDVYYSWWNQPDSIKNEGSSAIEDYFDREYLDTVNQIKLLTNNHFHKGFESWEQWGNSDVALIESDNLGVALIGADHPDEGISHKIYVDVGDTIVLSAYVKVIKWSNQLRLSVKIPAENGYKIFRIKPEWEGDNQWHQVKLKVVFDSFGSIPFWVGGGDTDSASLSLWTGFDAYKESASLTDTLFIAELPSIDIESLRNSNRYFKTMPPKLKRSEWNEPPALKNRVKKQVGQITGMKHFHAGLIDTLHENQGLLRSNQDSLRIGRKGRWIYAVQLFQGYSVISKITGDGFSYLADYGEHFYDDNNIYDYPHNPFLSALLYSGIIGLLVLITYLFIALILYVKNFRELDYFLILFLVTGIFALISGNSFFSIPIMVFLSGLPYVYRLLKGKEKHD